MLKKDSTSDGQFVRENVVQKNVSAHPTKIPTAKPVSTSAKPFVTSKIKSELASKYVHKKMPAMPQTKFSTRWRKKEGHSIFWNIINWWKKLFTKQDKVDVSKIQLTPVTIHTSVKVSQLRIFDCTHCGKIITVPEMESQETFLCKKCSAKYSYGAIIEKGYIESFSPEKKKERMKWANYIAYAIIFLLTVPMAGIMLETKKWLWGSLSIVGISIIFRWAILKVYEKYSAWMKLWGWFFTILGATLGTFIWVGALLRDVSPYSVSDFFLFPLFTTALGIALLFVDKIDSRKLKMF